MLEPASSHHLSSYKGVNLILSQAKRDPDEEGDYMAFEQLMAEAAVKKGKDEKKDDKKDAKKAKKE